MYARVATMTIKPTREEAFLLTLRNQGVPVVLARGGLHMDVFLAREQQQAMVTTLWPTQRAAETAADDADWQDMGTRLAQVLEGEPRIQIMERAYAW